MTSSAGGLPGRRDRGVATGPPPFGRHSTRWSVSVVLLVGLLLVTPVGPHAMARGALGAGADALPADADAVDRALARAVEANRDLPHTGRVTVVSFGDGRPQISEVDLTRGVQGVRVEGGEGWVFGRVDGQSFLRSSDTLLRVGGVERIPAQLDRLRRKYDLRLGATVTLDTGPARAVEVIDASAGHRREVLYLDVETGLVVRRETFAADGRPVRLVAYTALDVGVHEVVVPTGDGLAVEEHLVAAADRQQLARDGFRVPERLPRAFELLAALTVPDTTVPTLHLVYGDGLYTISIFQQRGRMARTAVDGAVQLDLDHGGAVWRMPGSEPRRVVWSGEGSTWTALTDAPSDELLAALSGLPADPPPSTLDRLGRGIARVGRWLWPDD